MNFTLVSIVLLFINFTLVVCLLHPSIFQKHPHASYRWVVWLDDANVQFEIKLEF